jgi:hypothetical protein
MDNPETHASLDTKIKTKTEDEKKTSGKNTHNAKN